MAEQSKGNWRSDYEEGDYTGSNGPSLDGIRGMLFEPVLSDGHHRTVQFMLNGSKLSLLMFLAVSVHTVHRMDGDWWMITGTGRFIGPGFRTVAFEATYNTKTRKSSIFTLRDRATMNEEEMGE